MALKKSFGFLGGCTVKVDGGYIEVIGVAMGARARIPLAAVEYAVAQRAVKATTVTGQTQVVLFGHGAELGRADLALGKRRAAEQAAEWINAYLAQSRA